MRPNLLSLLITSFLTISLASGASVLPPPSEQQLAREIFKEMIEIRSGFTTGATTPVVEAVAKRLRAAGFAESDLFIGGASEKKANLVVRYHGAGQLKPLLLLAHTDVVEAKREDWSTDPFQFLEKDGYFYGRGTSDDKAQAAVWIANLIRYKRENFKPNRDLIVALTADEEGGGPFNGVAWLIKNKPDLIASELCLNEGGFGEVIDGKNTAMDVQVSEKYVINYRLEVRNKGGHSSMPVRDNAIYHLAGALQHIAGYDFPIKTNAVTQAYFAQLAKLQNGPLHSELAEIGAGSLTNAQTVADASPAYNSTLRTTCVATMLEGGHALNALPQLAAANVNCRVLPEDSADSIKAALKKTINDDQVEIKMVEDPIRGPESPLNPKLMSAVAKITDSLWPNVIVVPTMVMGATDGRFLREAHIPTYGIQGFFLDAKDFRAHGRDERMPVQSFYEGQTFLYDLVKTLSSQSQ